MEQERIFVVLGLIWLMLACENLFAFVFQKQRHCFAVYKFESNHGLTILFLHLLALIVYMLPFNLSLALLLYFTVSAIRNFPALLGFDAE